MAIKKISDSALAYLFGWAPLVSDIKKLVETLKKRDKRAQDLLRDAGRSVHKRYDFPVETDVLPELYAEGTLYNPSCYPIFTIDRYYNGSWSTRTTRVYTKTMWAEGSFRYILPDMPDLSKLRKSGLDWRFTPSVAYNLIPWSFVVDYFTNLGDLISNLTPSNVAESLIADYAHIMCTEEWTTETFFTQSFSDGSTTSGSYKTTYSIKSRVPASPFGFGFTDSDLSPKQQGILGLLGLSRLA